MSEMNYAILISLKNRNIYPQPVAQLVAVENFYETLTVL